MANLVLKQQRCVLGLWNYIEFGQRIRGYWGVENKVHYVRDVTQGEDKSRIRTKPLPQIMAIALKFSS